MKFDLELFEKLSKAVLYANRGGLVSRRELFDAMAPVLSGFQVANSFQF